MGVCDGAGMSGATVPTRSVGAVVLCVDEVGAVGMGTEGVVTIFCVGAPVGGMGVVVTAVVMVIAGGCGRGGVGVDDGGGGSCGDVCCEGLGGGDS